jgi:hypothetical protein
MRALVRNRIKQTLDKRQKRLTGQPAVIGTPAGIVDVPGKPNYVYVQMAGSIIDVLNVRVPSAAGLSVRVGFDPLQPNLLQVLSQRNISSGQNGSGVPTVQSHHKEHEYPLGRDIVYSQLRQFMPFRVAPAGGFTVSVYRGIAYGDTAWHVVQPPTPTVGLPAAATTLDLSSYVVTTSGKAVLVLISLSTAGALVTTAGSQVDIRSLTTADIPAAPAGTSHVLAAVRMYYGQLAINENIYGSDIVDLRFPMLHFHAASGGGGTVVDDVSISRGRLTLESGVPISTTDQTAKTTLYFTPYNGYQIALYSGTVWELFGFSELSIAVPSTTNQMYDVFCYNNSGTPMLELLAWTSDTVRATALVRQNGILCKTGDLTRRYIGSMRTTGVSGQTEDSYLNRLVWNYYNHTPKLMSTDYGYTPHSYSGTWRYYNNDSSKVLSMVCGFTGIMVNGVFTSMMYGPDVMCQFNIDSATNLVGAINHNWGNVSHNFSQSQPTNIMVGIGYHTIGVSEQSNSGSGLFTLCYFEVNLMG